MQDEPVFRLRDDDTLDYCCVMVTDDATETVPAQEGMTVRCGLCGKTLVFRAGGWEFVVTGEGV